MSLFSDAFRAVTPTPILTATPRTNGWRTPSRFVPESNLIYVNADTVLQTVLDRIDATRHADLKLVVCDLSASPFMDLAGSAMLHKLHAELAARKIALRIIGAHGRVRELLRDDGLAPKVGGVERGESLSDALRSLSA